MKSPDLAGKRFGKLTVLSRLESRRGMGFWLCRCDCGNEREVQTGHLRQCHTQSCGCLHTEKAHRTHGLSNSPEYGVWAAMKRRCYNPRVPGWKWYGGKGIQVCERWRTSFASFLTDMGPRPAGMTLERLDGNGNYEPSNCAWRSRKEQANNTSGNYRFTAGSETKTLAEWSDATGIPAARIRARLTKLGMTGEEAIRDVKLRGDGTRTAQQLYTHGGKTMTLGDWAVETGLGYQTLWARIFVYEWPLEKALSLGLQQ